MDYISKPFFTVFVRACNRPIRGIEHAIKSVKNQTCKDVEILIAFDTQPYHPEGNILFANGQFDRYKDYTNGLYILPLDDDGFYINKTFLSTSKNSIIKNDYPGCLIVRNRPAKRKGMQYDKLPCPEVWDTRFELGERPYKWCGNGGNWIVRHDVFNSLAIEYKKPRGGDWFFMTSVCDAEIRIVKCDVIGQSHIARSYGKQSSNNVIDWRKLADKFGFEISTSDNLIRGHL